MCLTDGPIHPREASEDGRYLLRDHVKFNPTPFIKLILNEFEVSTAL